MRKIVLLLMLSFAILKADSLEILTKDSELEICNINRDGWFIDRFSYVCINGVLYLENIHILTPVFTQDSKVVKCSCEKEKDINKALKK